ncbi:MAG: protein phosphatase CheZ [Candidatus Latescibacteria bacterium]|nr:protein phosphatase CheZ [Candidatus Latescibacterota bacterium]
MEKAEISRLINSFNAIKGYFDTTKRYMPQIAKLVYFIEEVVPLLNTIHSNLNQSTSLIPSATEKLDKVTSATEMATTEVMDIVDQVIERLNVMTETLKEIEDTDEEKIDISVLKEKSAKIHEQIDGSQDDLFSIMNALQFQDITTQQINAIASTIDQVNRRLSELLKGFEDEGIDLSQIRDVAFDPDAEFDFERSAHSQKMVDELLKGDSGPEAEETAGDTDEKEKPVQADPEESTAVRADETQEDENIDDLETDVPIGDDGQPDISAIMNHINTGENKS